MGACEDLRQHLTVMLGFHFLSVPPLNLLAHMHAASLTPGGSSQVALRTMLQVLPLQNGVNNGVLQGGGGGGSQIIPSSGQTAGAQ